MKELEKNTQTRRKTDKQLSPILTLLPVIYFASILALAISPLIPGLLILYCMSMITVFVTPLAFIYVGYQLIKRRNRHFKRQREFTQTLLDALQHEAEKQGDSLNLLLQSTRETAQRTESQERDRTPWIAVLLYIPFLNLLTLYYIAYTLMKDYHKHEQAEDAIWGNLRIAFAQLKLTCERSYPDIPDRNFVQYMVLSWFTFGTFYLYWLLCLIEDPNNHFKNHINIEDNIIKALEQLERGGGAEWPAF